MILNFPDSWSTKRLQDVFILKQGKYISPNDMVDNGHSIYGANGIIGKAVDYMYDIRTVLVSCRGANCGVVHYTKPKSWVNNNSIALVPKADDVLPEYVYYHLTKNSFLPEITGSAQPQIVVNVLNLKKIVLPPLPEQQKIAEILSTVDDAIEKTAAIIEETRQLKKGLMQKLFTEGIGHTKFKETKIGRIPEEWDVKSVKDVCNVVTSGLPFGTFIENKLDSGKKVIYMKVSDMNLPGNEKFIISGVNEGYFSDEFIISKSVVKPQSIIFPKRGAAIQTNKKRINSTFIILDPNLIAISFLDDSMVKHDYLYYFFQTVDLIRLQDNATIPQLNKRDLEPFKVPIPPIDEQNQISQILSEVDAKIEKEEATKAELEQLKKGLMQVLLTGKVRVRA